jgi:DNA-directed RNA polymerase specialized sigma24 family protein
VYRVAVNHCLKHRARVAPHTVPYDEAALGDREGDPRCDPARRAVQSELGDRVEAALAGLSADHRDVVVLHELHGLTYAECAQVFGVPWAP